MEIVRIEKRNLVDEVYKQMKDIILSGAWQEGERLASENQLAKRFAVSRVVIREALQRLRSEKLVVTRHGLGSFVSNPQNYQQAGVRINLTEQFYADWMTFRRGVEYQAIELAAQRATEQDFENLSQCLRRMAGHSGDVAAFSAADYEFHLGIALCSHNELLIRAFQSNRDIIIGIFFAMNSVPDSHGFGVDMHEHIVKGLTARRAKEVLQMYDRHAAYNTTRLSAFFSREDDPEV